MDMQDFPPNSQKAAAQSAPPEPKRIERVTTAEVERRKKGIGRKFKEAFIVGDARMAWQYIITDVVVPSIQDILIESFQGGIERLIKGEGARSRRSSYRPWWEQGGYGGVAGPGHVDYTAPSSAPRPGSKPARPPQRQLSRMSRARNEFDELIIPDRRGAEEVIERMFDILSKYGSVSVADLYELTGLASTHTDVKWGWTQLRGARAERLPRGGFVLNLPEPQPLG